MDIFHPRCKYNSRELPPLRFWTDRSLQAATALFGILALFFLPHSIAQAWFLTEEERIVAHARLQTDSHGVNMTSIEDEKFSWYWVRLALKSMITWFIVLPYLLLAICVYVSARAIAPMHVALIIFTVLRSVSSSDH